MESFKNFAQHGFQKRSINKQFNRLMDNSFDKFIVFIEKHIKFLDKIYDKLGNFDYSLIHHILYGLYSTLMIRNIRDAGVTTLYMVRNIIGDYERFKQNDVIRIKDNFINALKEILNGVIIAESNWDFSNFTLNFNRLIESDFYHAVKNFILSLVTLKFFPKGLNIKISKFIGKPRKVDYMTCVGDIFNSLEKIVDTVQKMWKQNSTHYLFYKDDRVSEFHDQATLLLSDYNRVYLSDIDDDSNSILQDKISSDVYLLRMRQCISLYKELEACGSVTTSVKILHSQLMLNSSQLKSKLLGKSRKAPIGFIIVGPSNIGKSSIITHLCKLYCNHLDIPYSDRLYYQKNSKDDYWEGYDPDVNLFIRIPEPGSMARSLAARKGDAVMDEILVLSDNGSLAVNMAALEGKGSVFAKPLMLLMDCNDEKMNLDVLYNNAAAYRRRFIYIRPTVKEEYRKNGSDELDSERIGNMSDEELPNRMDLWNFEVVRKQPTSLSASIDVRIPMKSNDIFGLSNMVISEIKKHETKQKGFMRAVDEDVSKYVYAEGFIKQSYYSLIYKWWYKNNTLTISDYFTNTLNNTILYIYIFSFFLYKRFSSSERVRNWTYFLSSFSVFCLIVSGFFYCSDTLMAESLYHSTDNPRDYLNQVEKDVESKFCTPRKKSDSSKDYDDVETFEPRVNVDSRTLNRFSDIKNTVLNNIRTGYIVFKDGDTSCVRGIGIYSDILISNTHYFEHDKEIEKISLISSKNKGNCKVFNWNNIQRFDLGNDITVLRIPGYIFRDIRYYIPNRSLSSFKRGNFKDVDVDIRYSSVSRKFFNPKKEEAYIVHRHFTYHSPHKFGDCSLPLFGFNNNSKMLVGIHAGGFEKSDCCYAVALSLDLFEFLWEKDDFMVYSEGGLKLPVEHSVIEKVQPNHPFLYEDIRPFNVIGHIKDYPNVCPKSKLVKTSIYDEASALLRVNYTPDIYGIPKMRSFRLNGEFCSPYNNWLRKFKFRKNLDIKISEEVTSFLVSKFVNEIPHEFKPIPLDVAHNGHKDDFYLRSINMSTSGGYFFPGKKRNYANIDGDIREPTEEILSHVCDMIKSYREGCCAHPVLGAQLKDEVRPQSRCINGKTRVFAMSSYDVILLNKMFLSSFYTTMVSHPKIFCSALGFNMHSRKAHEMASELLKFNNPFQGDYSGYDTSMPITVSYEVNKIIYRVSKNKGFNAHALKILNGILSDNLNPILSIQGTLAVMPGFQPSGKYGTAEDNTLRGLYLLMYFFSYTCTKTGHGTIWNKSNLDYTLSDFFRLTVFYIYGDDLAGSVSDEIKDNFNCIIYSKFCREIYGMKFTDANKEDHTRKFVKFEELSFLKRSFKFNKNLGRFVAILDPSSCYKTLLYSLKSSSVSLDVQLIESCASVLRERFFDPSFTKETYGEMLNDFIDILSKRTIYSKSHLSSYFKTYDELTLYYKS